MIGEILDLSRGGTVSAGTGQYNGRRPAKLCRLSTPAGDRPATDRGKRHAGCGASFFPAQLPAIWVYRRELLATRERSHWQMLPALVGSVRRRIIMVNSSEQGPS